jgi:hypothetical protein
MKSLLKKIGLIKEKKTGGKSGTRNYKPDVCFDNRRVTGYYNRHLDRPDTLSWHAPDNNEYER